MEKNVLGVAVTRPNQVLNIMRGVSGSGKSTKAREIVGDGVIHSTDDLIESITGDYDGFFKSMIKSGKFHRLTEMHNKNFLNAKKSMESGVKNIVIDNTNIKASEPKKYVVEALKLGYHEDNIKIVDVGSGGATVKVLSERNTHGVPLDKIKKMVASHKGVGELTVKKILEAKDLDKRNDVLYAAVVLDDESIKILIEAFTTGLSEDWKTIAHHMTIVFGKGLEDKEEIGKEVELKVTELGFSDLAMAVKVEGYPSSNLIPHVTVAVNIENGGKPYDSNKITNWGKVDLGYELKLYGTVTEVKREGTT
jgi:DNA-binding transcriptional ArsR family regulator